MSVYREAGAGYLARTKDLTPRTHAMRGREEGLSPRQWPDDVCLRSK
jgi:hypothetical protein